MNTIYLLSLTSSDDYLCGFAGNDEEIRWLAIKYHHKYNHNLNVDGLKVRAEIDWEARTVTVTDAQETTSVDTTYYIYKITRVTQEDVK